MVHRSAIYFMKPSHENNNPLLHFMFVNIGMLYQLRKKRSVTISPIMVHLAEADNTADLFESKLLYLPNFNQVPQPRFRKVVPDFDSWFKHVFDSCIFHFYPHWHCHRCIDN